MLARRTFQVLVASHGRAVPFSPAPVPQMTVEYTGAASSLSAAK
jgi:hypothetical protein